LTVNEIKKQLQLINTKSQQLLKRLEYDVETDENIALDEITQLQAARERLISNLFTQYLLNDIHAELLLINKMVSLDAKLQLKTAELKQDFANKLIKLQKGKKSASTYKKY
jgi:hypothetical protein